MKTFFSFLLVLIRFFICFKVCYLLYYSNSSPTQEITSNLNWWVAYLVFDIWLQVTVLNNKTEDND